MPVLDILSGNQLQAVSGRRRRPILGDLLLEARADLPARMAFQQRERELALQEEDQRLNAQALARQEQAQREAAAAQARGQRQQVIGTAISGVGQAGQLYVLGKSGGLFGGGTTAASATAAPSTAAGTSLIAAEESAGLAGAESASATAPAATGSLSTLAAGAGIAAIGAGAGYGLSKAPIPRYGSALAGAGAGAGLGALAGTFVFPGIGTAAGAIIGGIAGGLTGGLCIIATACAQSAEEIALAKRFRERFMSPEAKRGYYVLAEGIAARMQADPDYCHTIRHGLVLPLMRYGAWELGETEKHPSVQDQDIAGVFLGLCEELGRSVRQYTRQTGEVI